MAIGVIATLKVQQDKAEEAEATFRELQSQVQANEKNCLFYSFFKAEAGVYVVLESYASQEDLATHSQTDYFKAAGKKMAGFLAGAPDIKTMDSI